MIDRETVKNIVEDFLRHHSDLFLTDLKVEPDNRLTVEIDSDKAVSIDECADLTRFIESHLDREVEDYELEVGSAGISQAFKQLRQYRKNQGREVETLTKNGKKLTGILKDADDTQLTLTLTKQIKPEGAKRKITVEEDVTLPYEEIKYTKNIIKV
ncbi:MAG: ribosome assembly cofactor RimP [Candidatus Symbiothrix sp.]|jgi:ribosome maturation factor RimP|nr:ribosome assembly cofactor RimP [Candidatus Symbiothrix sp.]